MDKGAAWYEVEGLQLTESKAQVRLAHQQRRCNPASRFAGQIRGSFSPPPGRIIAQPVHRRALLSTTHLSGILGECKMAPPYSPNNRVGWLPYFDGVLRMARHRLLTATSVANLGGDRLPRLGITSRR